MNDHTYSRGAARALTALALGLLVALPTAACGSAGASSDPKPVAAEHDPVSPAASHDQDPAQRRQDKQAGSIAELAQRALDQGAGDYQGAILRRTVQSGSMNAADYEDAWSKMRQCVADQGYPEYSPHKTSSGIYSLTYESQSGARTENSSYGQAVAQCQQRYVADVSPIYQTQLGNPGLYRDTQQAAIDCLQRAGFVPKSYTVEQFDRERARSDGDESKMAFDFMSPQAQSCLVPNNIDMLDVNDSRGK
ncbi:hypothetical protein BACT_0226 [Bifidobacterium actinocoloniiforme DSM 22766]|uniref:Lipoprotein n=1 Tax=Bifidobacterium actinocoloniiforme DSM 22766 TaxID=1437605 RepID=A0A086YYP4_9BIFI|nr:hypothetical protein [Bifidobacterium actinocoloniiforme]AKV55916.1 hypothetical protein AB656_06965 [Bifidobacterium actinocoloniiforme DSM 22766]KFI39394.1 hypothetical protein BACT_0226 [Bifidobacterium actinocoloniiforme DSM 22766]